MKTSNVILVCFVIEFCFVKADVANIEKRFDYVMSKNAGHSIQLSYSSLFDMLRELMKQGYLDAGIPVLDPYQIDHVNINFQNDIFRILANITDVTFAGLSDFSMRKFGITVEEGSMYVIDFDVYFSSLTFTSEYYTMEGSIIQAFPLAGEGATHVVVYDLNLWSKLYLRLSTDGSGAFIDRLEDPGFHISRIVSKIEYDNNIDDIANAMVEELLAEYLNRFNKYLAAKYSPLIIEALNPYLSEN